MIRRFFKAMVDVVDSLARARAAAELSRRGHHEQAKALLLRK